MTGLERADILSKLLHERWSCRGFRNQPVPELTVSRLLEMAQRSPSWCNVQPWQLTIVTGARLEQLRSGLVAYVADHAPEPDLEFPPRYEGIYLERRRESGWELYRSVGIEKGDRQASSVQGMENFRFFGAPALAVVTTERALGVYGAVDCGVYIGYFLLAAQSLGLATIAQAAIAAYSPFIREQLGIPSSRQVVAGIAFGYADAVHPTSNCRTSRAAIEDVAAILR